MTKLSFGILFAFVIGLMFVGAWYVVEYFEENPMFEVWSPPSGGITVLQSTYLFKYTLHEIHVTHAGGVTDTTYVYRVLCQEVD